LRDFKEFCSALNASRADVGFIASASSWKCKRIPSERINHVLLLFREAMPAERSAVWRKYDIPLRYVHRYDDGIDTGLMELSLTYSHERGPVRLIKLSRCIEPSRLRLSHRVTISLAALRSRLDLDVQGCRLLRAIKCAQSRGCKGVFCTKCVRSKCGVFC